MADPSSALRTLIETHRRLKDQYGDLEADPQMSQVAPVERKKCLNSISCFITECIEQSADIPFVEEREQVLEIVDHWGTVMFRLTGEFAPSSLKPSQRGLTWVGMTWKQLRDACRRQAHSFVENKTREDIYYSDLAVPRFEINQRVQQFLNSDSLAIVLIGRAGVGKTFLVCQMAEQSQKDKGRIVLPYDSSRELVRRVRQSVPDSSGRLSDVIGGIIAGDLGYANTTALEEELTYLGHVLEERNAHLLICFDGIERFSVEDQTADHLLVALDSLVQRFAQKQEGLQRIKFLMTSLDSSWSWLGADDLLSPRFYFPQRAPTDRPSQIAWVMKPFSDNEFKHAYGAYTGHMPPDEELENIRSICQSNPYLLRIAAGLVRRDEPVTQESVLGAFYETRVRRGSQRDQAKKERFLADFMRDYDRALGGVPAIKAALDDPAYTMLTLDGVLVQEIVQRPFTQIVLKLSPNGLADHFLERFKTV